MSNDEPLWEKEPSENDWAAANRGALVPEVAIWKSRNGKELNPSEQAFAWGYVHGMDDRLKMVKRSVGVLDEAVRKR